jgi:2-polyprenyl-3-methyl-5-hydroxy-6-metoxy-1,4-benzoquinol methylase
MTPAHLQLELPLFGWATHTTMQLPQLRGQFAALERAQDRFNQGRNGFLSQAPARRRQRWYRWLFGERIPFEIQATFWSLHPLYEWSRRFEYPLVAELMSRVAPTSVLDAGAGVGFFPFFLASELSVDVSCLDVDPAFPNQMQHCFESLQVRSPDYYVRDLTQPLNLSGRSFDAVVCISVLEHLPPEKRLKSIEHLWEVLRPGGILLLTFDVALTGETEGFELRELPGLLSHLTRILGRMPELPEELPPDLLTPQRPGYRFAPARIGTRLLRRGPLTAYFDWRRLPLPRFKPLACLFCAARKPK